MFLFLGLLAAAPFMLLADWFKFIRHLPPREQNLARASHGAGMLVFAAIALYVAGFGTFFHALGAGPAEPVLWASALLLVATVVWGISWLIVGCRRARGARDALLALRAAGKIGAGIAACIVAQGGYVPRDWSAADFIAAALLLIGVWCMVTGAVKFILVMIGTGGGAERAVRRNIEEKSAPLLPARRRDF